MVSVISLGRGSHFAILLPRVRSVGSGISGSTLLKITGYVIAVAGLGLRFQPPFWLGGFVDVGRLRLESLRFSLFSALAVSE